MSKGSGEVFDSNLGLSPSFNEEVVDKQTKQLAEQHARRMKWLRHHQWRGSDLPPFNIEPSPHHYERVRMNPEMRALRKQWIEDQALAPHEPIFYEELYPRNPIRRMLAAPWNLVFNSLKPIVGIKAAFWGRYLVPRFAMVLGSFWFCWYHLKYNPSDWTHKAGWHIYQSKPPIYPGDEIPEGYDKDKTDYHDKGFKGRKVFLDMKNSQHLFDR